MALSPVGEPRDRAALVRLAVHLRRETPRAVGDMLAAYVKGLPGRGPRARRASPRSSGTSPAPAPAKGGFDARLAKGKFLAYPGNRFDDHVGAVRRRRFQSGAAGGHRRATRIPETGAWTGQGGLVNGRRIEQVGASFNAALLTGRAPRPARLRRPRRRAPGRPRGRRGRSARRAVGRRGRSPRPQRVAKAVEGRRGPVRRPLRHRRARRRRARLRARLDAAAGRALALAFQLGLFENPYVDAGAGAARSRTPTPPTRPASTR